METDYTREQQYIKARKKVKEIKGFYIHLATYVLVIPFIIYVNLRYVPQFHWFWYSVLSWGVGLFFHWFGVIGIDKFKLGKEWEEKKIREIMNNNKRY